MHFPSSVQILLRHPWRKFTQLFNPVYFWLRWHFYHSWCLSTKWIFQRLEHVEVKWGQICKNSRWCSSSNQHSQMVAMTVVDVCAHTLLWQSSISLHNFAWRFSLTNCKKLVLLWSWVWTLIHYETFLTHDSTV